MDKSPDISKILPIETVKKLLKKSDSDKTIKKSLKKKVDNKVGLYGTNLSKQEMEVDILLKDINNSIRKNVELRNKKRSIKGKYYYLIAYLNKFLKSNNFNYKIKDAFLNSDQTLLMLSFQSENKDFNFTDLHLTIVREDIFPSSINSNSLHFTFEMNHWPLNKIKENKDMNFKRYGLYENKLNFKFLENKKDLPPTHRTITLENGIKKIKSFFLRLNPQKEPAIDELINILKLLKKTFYYRSMSDIIQEIEKKHITPPKIVRNLSRRISKRRTPGRPRNYSTKNSFKSFGKYNKSFKRAQSI